MTNKHILGKKPTLKFLLDWYDVWLRESEYESVSRALEISEPALRRWEIKHKDLQFAKQLAFERRGKMESFSGYIFQHLSEKARAVWEQVQFWQDSGSATIKIEKILNGQTIKLRQELFVHALVNSNFDLSTACRMVAVSRRTLEEWRQDPDFRELINEIQWHKKNFFEHALVDLVAMRHPGATVWVNKTLNADRGYGEKVEVQHSGQLDVSFSIDELDLDLSTRRKILDAMHRKKDKSSLPNVIDLPPTIEIAHREEELLEKLARE